MGSIHNETCKTAAGPTWMRPTCMPKEARRSSKWGRARRPKAQRLPDYRMQLSNHRRLEIRLLRKKQNGRLNYRKWSCKVRSCWYFLSPHIPVQLANLRRATLILEERPTKQATWEIIRNAKNISSLLHYYQNAAPYASLLKSQWAR